MSDEALAYLSAIELLAAYRAGSLSPVEVTRNAMDRIAQLNPVLNCFCLVEEEGALAQARLSEARWRKHEPLGALDGVPVSIKDLILTRGWPTLRGSRTVDPAGPWLIDAPATARLRESGAVLLGKTTTPEFGWRGSTDSPLTGITRNPWNTACTPGGSSGGATAAIAAGLGALAVGTDGGGSVRIPAAFTGTVGLKAHFGRIPAYPLSPMGSVAHIGPHARTVTDCALLLDVLAQPDVRDWNALPPPTQSWSDSLAGKGPAGRREGTDLRGLRIAYSPRLGYVPWVDETIEAAVAQAARVFAELGAHVETIDPPIEDSAWIFAIHWFTSARNLLHRLPPSKLALLDPGLHASVMAAQRFSAMDFVDAQNARNVLAHSMRTFSRQWDLVLTPATAVLPFAVGRVTPEATGPMQRLATVDPNDWTWWTPFSFPFNLTQQPALVMGCGFSPHGLPVSMQLVAPNHREDLCLAAALAYERATSWGRKHPGLHQH